MPKTAVDYTLLALRLILGILFIWSAAPKILQLEQFAQVVQSYQLVPPDLAAAFAFMLPWAELLIGLLLTLGVFTRLASGAAAALLLLFMGVVGISLIRGTMPADCGCYGLAELFGGSGEETLIRDVPLLLMSLVLMVFGGSQYSILPHRVSRAVSTFQPGAAALLGIVTVIALGGSFFYGANLASASAGSNGELQIVSVEEVKQLIDQQADFVLVDVRAEYDYQEAHLPRAISIPLHEIEDRAGELPKDKTIIVYCESDDCGSSASAMRKLTALGYTRVKDMKDGIWGWEAAGYETE